MLKIMMVKPAGWSAPFQANTFLLACRATQR